MKVRYTLLTDGSSDRMLLPIINWTLRRLGVRSFTGVWADLRHAPEPSRSLAERIERSLSLFPCDVLLIHRDAEAQGHAARRSEIEQAAVDADGRWVPVIPVRMSEAWLLFDEDAIRAAAGRPGGRVPLALPRGARVEAAADPKELLDDALVRASGATGRRLTQLQRDLPHRRHRVAELIDDFSPLMQLLGYREFHDDLGTWLQNRRVSEHE